MQPKSLILIVITGILLLVVSNSLYIVTEMERGIKLRFGAVNDPNVGPGLHFKWPFGETARIFDSRVLTLDSDPERYLTAEKKPLMVDSFVKWRIIDVENYYTATSGDERRVELLLQQRVNEGLRNQISRRAMQEVISGERDQLMAELKSGLDEVMRAEFGVEIVDVRVKKIDLPDLVSSAVYSRMNSERRIEAQEHRATGEEKALAIRAGADRQVVVIRAEAYRDAETLRGDGDAQSASTYAKAFSQDEEFYAFYRSINAYTEVFNDKGDLMVLDPKSDFFKYLKQDGL
ncbi:MAG: protease modulator HflC [Pseudomonadales bacterium]|nr:protease modulator HflC [Pseudomonadales bacterium]